MKLRVRLNRQTSRLELSGEDPTLGDLVDQIRLTLLPAHGLSADTEFSLSLNGTEPLSDDGQTLSSCSIVSGDLICVILPEHVAAPPPASSSVTEQPSSSATAHSTAVSSTQPSCSSPTTDSLMDDDPDENSEALDPGPSLPCWEPMLCSEAEDGQAPHSLELLYHEANITSPSDAIIVAGNLLMLETGFTHQECELKSVDMPAGWRGAGGVYKLKYTHALCENSVACLVAVCTGSTLIINATLKINETADTNHKLCLNPSDYVTNEWPEKNAAIAFKNLKKMSRIFKDQLAYPLIAAAREAMALPVAFGLAALPLELLLRVFRLLDVRSVTRMAVVSKHFHNTTSDFMLWRHLFLRDFRDPDAMNRPRDTNWKELYKRHYKICNERQRLRHHRSLPPYPSPRDIFGVVPIFEPFVPGIIGGEYDQRPALPRALLPRPRQDPFGPFRNYPPRSGGRDRGFI